MKKVTASEARRLLDEAARGEVIVVERKGRRLVLRREEVGKSEPASARAKYRDLLRVPHADQADRWSWEWRGPGRLTARRASAK